MDRNAKYLWMNDLLEHLGSCYDQWQNADERTGSYLQDSIRRDLAEFQQLCHAIRLDDGRAAA